MLIRFHRRVALSLAAAILAVASGSARGAGRGGLQGRFRRARHHAATGHGGARRLRQGVCHVDPRPVQGAGGGVRRRPLAGGAGERRRRVRLPRPWCRLRGRRSKSNAAFRPKRSSSGPRIRIRPAPWGWSSRASTTTPRRWCGRWPMRNRRAPMRKYLEHVRQQIVAAVCQADQSRAASRCGVGKGIEDHVAFNRRQRMKNGLTYTHRRPGQSRHPRAMPARPTRRSACWAPGTAPASCWAASSTSPATPRPTPAGSRPITSTIWSRPSAALSARRPSWSSFPAIPATSRKWTTSAPTPIPRGERLGADRRRARGGRSGQGAAEHGAGHAGRRWMRDRRCCDHVAACPARTACERSLELVTEDPKKVGPTEWAFAKEIVLLDALLAKSPVAEVEVQAIQVGPAVFLASPGELFCQYQLRQKAAKPVPDDLLRERGQRFHGLRADRRGAGPARRRLRDAADQRAAIWNWRAGRRIVEAALELARQMTPGALPERPKAPPFRQPWAYGNVPARAAVNQATSP